MQWLLDTLLLQLLHGGYSHAAIDLAWQMEEVLAEEPDLD